MSQGGGQDSVEHRAQKFEWIAAAGAGDILPARHSRRVAKRRGQPSGLPDPTTVAELGRHLLGRLEQLRAEIRGLASPAPLTDGASTEATLVAVHELARALVDQVGQLAEHVGAVDEKIVRHHAAVANQLRALNAELAAVRALIEPTTAPVNPKPPSGPVGTGEYGP